MRKSINFLAFSAILFLPFDSIPGVLPSEYRPISIWFLVIAFPLVFYIITVKNKTIKKPYLILLLFIIYSVLFSFLFSGLKYSNYSGAIDFTVTLIIGGISFVVFDYYLSQKRLLFSNNQDYLFSIFKFIGNIYIFILLYGVYEIFVVLGLFPGFSKEIVVRFLTGQSGARIQLFSSEASWATFHLIFIIPIYAFLMKSNKKYKKYFYLSIVILLMTFSIQGYVIVLFAMVLYLLFLKKGRTLVKYFLYFIVFVVIISIVFQMLQVIMGDVYFLSRFEKIKDISNIKDFFYIDGSVFIRTMYPIIGLLIFLKNPLLGIGGGNYRFELGNFISTYFPDGLMFPSVVNNINLQNGNSFNMLSRLLSETGIIGTILFIWFIANISKKVNILSADNKYKVLLFLLFILSIYMQFDSFAFIHIWLGLAIVNNITYTDYFIKRKV